MEICKAPPLQPKVLNKHNRTHSVYRDRECYLHFDKKLTPNIHNNTGSSITMYKMHTHTHTHMHARTHTCAHTHTHACTRTHECTHTHQSDHHQQQKSPDLESFHTAITNQNTQYTTTLINNNNNNNVHLSCAHQRPERSHDTY